MKTTIVLPINFSTIDDQTLVLIDFGEGDVVEWCLLLSLLQNDLIKSIWIHSTADEKQIEIRVNEVMPRRRANIELQGEKLVLIISKIELDYWASFFLKYYRDGFAEVDHIDVEVPPSKTLPGGAYITFKVSRVAPPVSEDEARRRLGLA